MEETQIKGNILENGLSFIEIGVECWAIPAIDLVDSEARGTTLQKLIVMKRSEVKVKWSEVKVKWSESEWVFGPLFFFNFRYIKVGVWGNNNIGIKKCTTIFLWVLNLGQVGGRQIFFQNHTTTVTFWKMVSNLIFWKILKEIYLEKVKNIFLKRFSCKIEGEF